MLGGLGAGQGAWLMLWGPDHHLGGPVCLVPYTPLLLCQEGLTSGTPPGLPSSPYFSPHLSSQMPVLGGHACVSLLLSSHPHKLFAWEQKS